MSDMADVKELRKDVKALRSQGHDSAANGVECIANRIEELEARLEIHDEIIAEKLEQIYRQSKRIKELEAELRQRDRVIDSNNKRIDQLHQDNAKAIKKGLEAAAEAEAARLNGGEYE